jgi:hypothetical protein
MQAMVIHDGSAMAPMTADELFRRILIGGQNSVNAGRKFEIIPDYIRFDRELLFF